MQLNPQIPEGWRELQPNETVQDGDLAAMREWVPSTLAGNPANTCPEIRYIRRIVPETPEGWRVLGDDEIIREGDKFVDWGGVWKPSYSAGEPVKTFSNLKPYIREIASEVPAFSKDADGYPVIPEGWRQLHAHEVLQDGDLFQCGNIEPEWTHTKQTGEPVWKGTTQVYIRRRKV